ncbi:MAG TPA: SpoIID/LytB domain-containing protein, partial [Candidatus Cloacimonadota bacterium]|nr:SpoIID/LytB domain-containing protein [Candidatus Cloacimonadota bacterium]
NPEAVALYGILERTEPFNIEALGNGVEKRKFAWEDSTLVLKRELQYFHSESFTDLVSARAFATSRHYPLSSIQMIPLINSTLCVAVGKSSVSYYESPLYLIPETEIEIDSYRYMGEFIVKVRNGKLVLNQILALEDYIAGVLPNEIGNNSPLPALQAQAVAARTHSVSLLLNNRHMADGYDLCNSTHCQVYKGLHLQNETILEAVSSTRHEVLFANGFVADATYHSACGGKTDSSAKIWKGKPIPHLMGVTCIPEADEYDLSSETHAVRWIDTKTSTEGMSSWERGAVTWEKSISKAQVAVNAGLSYLSRIEIIERSVSGRIVKLKLHGNTDIILDNEYKIRQVFGNLFSSFFYFKGYAGQSIITPGTTLKLKGKGAGHGVGLCQVGTLRMARDGKSYTDILGLYYPGTELQTNWMELEY